MWGCFLLNPNRMKLIPQMLTQFYFPQFHILISGRYLWGHNSVSLFWESLNLVLFFSINNSHLPERKSISSNSDELEERMRYEELPYSLNSFQLNQLHLSQLITLTQQFLNLSFQFLFIRREIFLNQHCQFIFLNSFHFHFPTRSTSMQRSEVLSSSG